MRIWDFIKFLPRQKPTVNLMAMPSSPGDSWTLREVKDLRKHSVYGASEEYIGQTNRMEQIRALSYSLMGQSSLLNLCDPARGCTSSCRNRNPFSSTSKICIMIFENHLEKFLPHHWFSTKSKRCFCPCQQNGGRKLNLTWIRHCRGRPA